MRLIKTSIHSNGSGTCARIGDVWNEEHQMFVEPQPVNRPLYVLDTTEGTWGPDTSNRPALTDYQQSVGMKYPRSSYKYMGPPLNRPYNSYSNSY